MNEKRRRSPLRRRRRGRPWPRGGTLGSWRCVQRSSSPLLWVGQGLAASLLGPANKPTGPAATEEPVRFASRWPMSSTTLHGFMVIRAAGMETGSAVTVCTCNDRSGVMTSRPHGWHSLGSDACWLHLVQNMIGMPRWLARENARISRCVWSANEHVPLLPRGCSRESEASRRCVRLRSIWGSAQQRGRADVGVLLGSQVWSQDGGLPSGWLVGASASDALRRCGNRVRQASCCRR